ncbi:vacuolar protein sorting-associated protein 8 homolog, partial [Micropterus dolomieu]|uniref:vacuolar protein sorting-associated protein 8 homolog n=1 Tax=Micropterus dolomieu TaxID=147949 RepID=UPI001E8CA46B
IDDKEFDIPQVDTPPTLESILNELEDEEEPFVLEDTCVLNTDNMDAHSCDTSSLASSDSGDPAHLKRKRRTVDPNATVHGSVVRHSLLKGISAQIVSAAVRLYARAHCGGVKGHGGQDAHTDPFVIIYSSLPCVYACTSVCD